MSYSILGKLIYTYCCCSFPQRCKRALFRFRPMTSCSPFFFPILGVYTVHCIRYTSRKSIRKNQRWIGRTNKENYWLEKYLTFIFNVYVFFIKIVCCYLKRDFIKNWFRSALQNAIILLKADGNIWKPKFPLLLSIRGLSHVIYMVVLLSGWSTPASEYTETFSIYLFYYIFY